MKLSGKESAILIGIIFYIALVIASIGTLFGGILIAVGVIALICLIVKMVTPSKEQKEQNKKQQLKLKERQERIKTYMPGDWFFPIVEFYELCCENNFTDINNNIHLQKMMLYAKDLAEKGGCPSALIDVYTAKDMMKVYIDLAKKEIDIEKKAKFEEEQKRYNTPQITILDSQQEEFIAFSKAVKDYTGFEKRKAYLEFDIYRNKLALAVAKQDYKKAKSLTAGAMYKPDWAIMGGIADAIAGPGAGVAVAAKTIADNQETEFDKMYKRLALSNELDKKSAIGQIEKNIAEDQKELETLNTKIHFEEFTTNQLFEQLLIEPKVSGEIPSKVSIAINNCYKKNPDIETVIDGTVQVKVYCDEVLVDDMCIALPKFGVECGKCKKLSVNMLKYMIGKNRKYRYEITPNKLYLLER